MTIKWMLLSFISATAIAKASEDPCSIAILLQNVEMRGTSCDGKTLDKLICDRPFTEGWYKAKLGNKMLQMPTTCPDLFACGTFGGIWLNGSYPDVVNSSKTVLACRRGTAVDTNLCCAEMFPITVKHCGNFYAFRLKYTSSCYQGYCFGDQNCSKLDDTSPAKTTKQTSTLSSVVGVITEDPCATAISLHSLELRGKMCNGSTLDEFISDRQLTKVWYKAERDDKILQMLTKCPEIYGCGTIGGIWFNGTHPDTVNTTLSVPVCLRGISANENECCAESFPIQIKHCGNFFAYHLIPTLLNYQAYCFGDYSCETEEDVTYPSSSTSVSPTVYLIEITGYNNSTLTVTLAITVSLLVLICMVIYIFASLRNKIASKDKSIKPKEHPQVLSANVFLYQEPNWKSQCKIVTKTQLDFTDA